MNIDAAETVDAFHFGRFHIVQPVGRGHRAGMDAMLLASMVVADKPFRLADLGAGAGAAGLAVASRLPLAAVMLVEKSAHMVGFADKTLALEGNGYMRDRIGIIHADVTLTGKARRLAGLMDDHFDHVIMNPPFNDGADRRAPDDMKAEAHQMPEGMFEAWIRTAGAIMKPGGQLSLIARPQSLADVIAACGKRFGGLQITPVHARPDEAAIRILASAVKGSRARISIRPAIILHENASHRFSAQADDLNNGRAAYGRAP